MRFFSFFIIAIAIFICPAQAGDKDAEIVTLVKQGWEFIAAQKNHEAIPPLEQALSLAGGPTNESPTTAYVLKARGTAYSNIGKYEEAEADFLRVVAIEKTAFPEGDPKRIEGIVNLGILYARKGNLDTAEPYFSEALGISDTQFGRYSKQSKICLNLLGQLYTEMGRKADADAILARVAAYPAD